MSASVGAVTPTNLAAILQRLERAGWPVMISATANATQAFLAFAEDDEPQGTGIRIDVPLARRNVALLMGWLVDCLELKGMRREVRTGYLSYDDSVHVVIVDGPTCKANGVAWGRAPTEIEALLRACSSLPEVTP